MIARIVLITGIVTLLALTASGCGGEEAAAHGTRVVAGFYPLAYAAEQVGGAGVEVRNLTPAGAEPHDLELTAQDVKAVRDADLVLYLGDGFMPALERAVAGRKGLSLDLLDGQRLSHDAGESGGDPHVWLDPVRYATMVKAIAAALGHEAAARGLVRRLDALDATFRRRLATCRRRQIVTSHAAFGYLASRYGLEQVALTGLSPEAEPSARSIARLVHRVEATGATTVFFEPLLSPELAETVAREAGARAAVLDPLEGIGKQELAAGADYVSVMRDNLDALRRALDCA